MSHNEENPKREGAGDSDQGLVLAVGTYRDEFTGTH